MSDKRDNSITKETQKRVSLQWNNLCVETVAGRKLIKGISGIANPGEVVALMGASGAGKTTLLNTLLQRNLKGLKISGTILVNGRSIGQAVTSVSAYVQQEDLFVGTLTVREHLVLQARMKLPCSLTEEERIARVEEVLRDMMLEGSQASRIGTPGLIKGISGGERKRLAFAAEILNNPPILFCDEPTTGLDSHMAMMIVKKLETLAADQGKTIICTIHQPSSETFELFDKVVFLAQGRIAFQGNPYEAVLFFSDCGYLLPDHTNPADHYIDTLAIWPGKVEECKSRCEEISKKYHDSVYFKRVRKSMARAEKPKSLTPHVGGWWIHIVYALLIRYTTDNLRNPSILRAKFVQKAFMGVFVGLLYFQMEPNQDGVVGLKGILFYYCSELTYSTIFAIQAYMPNDFPMVVREYHDGIYPVSAYYVAKILSYIPIFTLDGFTMVSISYYMIGLVPHISHFIQAAFTCMLIEWMVASLGVAICSITPSYAVAISISGPLLTVFSMTGGLFTNTSLMPSWISWVQYLSWFRFGYESLIINQFSHPSMNNLTCVDESNKVVDFCVHSGEEVLQEFSFSADNMYINWLMMLLWTLSIYCIGYIGLVYRVQKAR